MKTYDNNYILENTYIIEPFIFKNLAEKNYTDFPAAFVGRKIFQDENFCYFFTKIPLKNNPYGAYSLLALDIPNFKEYATPLKEIVKTLEYKNVKTNGRVVLYSSDDHYYAFINRLENEKKLDDINNYYFTYDRLKNFGSTPACIRFNFNPLDVKNVIVSVIQNNKIYNDKQLANHLLKQYDHLKPSVDDFKLMEEYLHLAEYFYNLADKIKITPSILVPFIYKKLIKEITNEESFYEYLQTVNNDNNLGFNLETKQFENINNKTLKEVLVDYHLFLADTCFDVANYYTENKTSFLDCEIILNFIEKIIPDFFTDNYNLTDSEKIKLFVKWSQISNDNELETELLLENTFKTMKNEDEKGLELRK